MAEPWRDGDSRSNVQNFWNTYSNYLDEKREAYSWPVYIKSRFTETVLNWYIVDIVLSSEEKINHLLQLNWVDPPEYAKPLLAEKDGLRLYVLGSKKIYNRDKQLIVPVGAEEDVYKDWITKTKNKFIDKKSELFASLKESAIVFNIDDKSTEIRRAMRSKVIGGRACTSYTESVLNAFSQWLIGQPFPEQVKTKKDRCLFLDLLVRESILAKKEGIFWITPEELQIFNEDEHRADLLKRLKD